MADHVALLRGINVGTAKRVPMADLRRVVESLGFSAPATLLNSGNVVFGADSDPDPEALRAAVLDRTGVDAAVVMLSAELFRAVAEANPIRRDDRDPKRIGVAFSGAPLDSTAAALVGDLTPALTLGLTPDLASGPASRLASEELVVGERAVYQWLPDGVLASRVPPAFWRALGTQVTARNDATVRKIVALLDSRA